MGTRKPNGESWISEKPNAQGLWEAKVWMGTKGDGRPDRRNVRRKSLPDLKRAVKKLEQARDAGRAPRAGRPVTVEAMMERHLNTILPAARRSPATIQSYRSLCKGHIYPLWGAQRSDRLLPEDVEDGIAGMLKSGLADSTVRKVFAILSSAYEVQVARGNLTRNPCEHVTAPSAPEGSMEKLTAAESRSVLLTAGDPAKWPNGARWAIGLGLGLRQGEALGLRWDYLNLETGELRIWWQLQRLTWAHGCGGDDEQLRVLTDDNARARRIAEIEHDCAAPHCKTRPCPKKCRNHTRACPPPCPAGCTSHARLCPQRKDGGLVMRPVKEKRHKTIWLAPEWVELLRKHREAQYLRTLAAESEWEDGSYVFCQWNGRPVDPRRDWAEWGALLTAAGLPRERVHAARHTAASILGDEGVAIAVVQEMLGHSDIRITRRYMHTGRAQSQDASGRSARALGLSVTDES